MLSHIKTNRKLLHLGLCLIACISMVQAQVRELPRAIPESEGVPSVAVTALFNSLLSLPQTDIHSVMVLRYGKVIGEIYPKPFDAEYKHTMYSCSKTFVGAAVGLAIDENLLRLDDRVGALLPDMLPDSVTPGLAQMTVRHLLTMTSGITPDWDMRSRTPNWLSAYLSKPVIEPGKHYQYDSMCSYVLSAIVQRVTGKRVLDYLNHKVFKDMNITNVAWEVSPEGFNTGGWGLYIQSESLAKFGLLLLNGGNWHGKQLLPEWWVKQMMTEHNAGTNYGYQIRTGEYPGAWDLDGALGQYVLIVPDKEMVIVITESTTGNGIIQRKLVWDQLLPQVADGPLPNDDNAYSCLQMLQQNSSLPYATGKANNRHAHRYEGKRYKLTPNSIGWQQLQLALDEKARTVTLSVIDDNGNSYDIAMGHRNWITSPLTGNPPYSINPVGRFNGLEGQFHAAGSYGWKGKNQLEMSIHYIDWISALRINIEFLSDENITLTVHKNYNSTTEVIPGTAY